MYIHSGNHRHLFWEPYRATFFGSLLGVALDCPFDHICGAGFLLGYVSSFLVRYRVQSKCVLSLEPNEDGVKCITTNRPIEDQLGQTNTGPSALRQIGPFLY